MISLFDTSIDYVDLIQISIYIVLAFTFLTHFAGFLIGKVLQMVVRSGD